MQSHTLIARLAGPLLVIIGLGMLANPGVYQAMISEFLHSAALVYLSGALTLLGGLAIVNVHNSWRAEWPVIVTILGWLMIIAGVIRIALPQFTVSLGASMYGSLTAIIVVAIIGLVIGAYLTFEGYLRSR
jgi:hypothetical protein